VFIDPSTRGTVRLRTGEGHSGWILQSVERSAATLQKGERTEARALLKPTAVEAPVVSTLPPPQSDAPGANAPQHDGSMPDPIGC